MSHDYSLVINTTPSILVTRRLEILLPRLPYIFIFILLILLIHSSRSTRAAIIRPLDTLAFLR